MSQANPSADILGLMKFIKRSNNPLTPIYEAIANSLESLANSKQEKPYINIDLHFSGILDDGKDLVEVKFTDNGEGFNQISFGRFQRVFNPSKGFNNRGTGRVQYLHRFDKIKVNSTYIENSKWQYREFESSLVEFIKDEEPKLSDNTEAKTVIALKGFKSNKSDREFFSALGLSALRGMILNFFSLRFFLEESRV